MTNILLGLIPEAIYFSIFIILTKNYKNKRKNLIFTLLLTLGYIMFKQILPRNVYCQIAYLLYVPFIMRVMYKEKWHISDMFVMSWATIILGILSILAMIPTFVFGIKLYWYCYAINRLLLVLFLIFCGKKLNGIYRYFISQWNRNYEKPNKIKALTVRNVCVITLNVTIYLLNLCMIFMSNIS